MRVIPLRSEVSSRGARMLRTALGGDIARWLDEPDVIEVMLNPDGRLWVERLGEGLAATECLMSAADGERIIRLVADRTDRLLRLFEGFFPEVQWLDDGETLSYLHSCISTRMHDVRVPETPMHLDALLADEPLTGGLEPRLGSAHLRTLTVIGFPSATFPGLLDDLNAQGFAYRWATRAIMLDKSDATKLLSKIRRQWFAKRKSVAAILKEVMTNEASVLVDSDAANKAEDADAALQELGADHVGLALVTATVTVWAEEPALAAEKLRLVEKVIYDQHRSRCLMTYSPIRPQ